MTSIHLLLYFYAQQKWDGSEWWMGFKLWKAQGVVLTNDGSGNNSHLAGMHTYCQSANTSLCVTENNTTILLISLSRILNAPPSALWLFPPTNTQHLNKGLTSFKSYCGATTVNFTFIHILLKRVQSSAWVLEWHFCLFTPSLRLPETSCWVSDHCLSAW